MDSLITVFFVVGVVGIGLTIAFSLLRPEPRTFSSRPAFSSEGLRLDRYRVMARLFCRADAELAETHPVLGRVARQRLVAGRRRIMRLYLRELRRDFAHFFSLCRVAAQYSSDPDYGMKSLRLSVAFHVSWATLWLQTYTARWDGVLPLFDELVGAVQLLRNHADHSLEQRSHAA